MKRSIDDITSSAVLSGSTVTERKVSVGRHMCISFKLAHHLPLLANIEYPSLYMHGT